VYQYNTFSKKLLWSIRLIILGGLLSCTTQSNELLSTSSVSSVTDFIITVSWDNNHAGITFYDLNGVYQNFSELRAEGFYPRGLTSLNADTLLVSGNGNDGIYSMDFAGELNLFFGASNLNGNIYDLAYDPVRDRIYVIETNNIEVFDSSGTRITSEIIPRDVGACRLDTPVDMLINSSGHLVVSNVAGSDDILTYDISTTPATCLSAVSFGSNPYAILEHSDGGLYVATTGDDQIHAPIPMAVILSLFGRQIQVLLTTPRLWLNFQMATFWFRPVHETPSNRSPRLEFVWAPFPLSKIP
jgi:hypothetical protein